MERMNRTFREKVLDATPFENIMQAQREANEWLKYYNEERPHSSLNNTTPNT